MRELERALDVLLRGVEVTLSAVAARPPLENVRAKQVGRKLGTLGELECGVQQPQRGRDARELVARDAELREHLGPLDIGERLALRERARTLEQRERFADLALVRTRPCFADERAKLELRRARRADGRRNALVGDDGVGEPVGLDERLGTCKHALDPPALVRRHTVREETWVDAEPRREPLHRLASRASLAALDLADVLLREAIAGELGLREPGRDAELAQAFAQPESGWAGEALRLRLRRFDHRRLAEVNSILHQRASRTSRPPPKGACMRRIWVNQAIRKSLDRAT